MQNKRQIGAAGEEYAAQLLVKSNLKIISRNYRCPKGEIDLIAEDEGCLVFVEVRSRSSGKQGWAEESITEHKRRKLYAVASYYLSSRGYKEYPPIRFDIVALHRKANEPEVKWLKGVFI